MEKVAEKISIVLDIVVGTKKNKNGNEEKILQGKPDFTSNGVIFYPIPKNLLNVIKEGETWQGFVCSLHCTNKFDKKKRPIYFQYFIPIKKWEANHAQ